MLVLVYLSPRVWHNLDVVRRNDVMCLAQSSQILELRLCHIAHGFVYSAVITQDAWKLDAL